MPFPDEKNINVQGTTTAEYSTTCVWLAKSREKNLMIGQTQRKSSSDLKRKLTHLIIYLHFNSISNA